MNKLTSWVAIVVLVAGVWGVALLTGTNRVRANNFTVMNLDDSGPGSLRDAIEQANANPGADTIDFLDELSGTITLTSGELLITDDLTINGPGIFAITVSGNNASRVFEDAIGNTISISGLTISSGASDLGGGILNRGGLTLTNVVLSGNSASTGGGIYNNVGTLKITNSTLSGNFSNTAGGGGGIYNSDTLIITNSTLSNNSANGSGDGGGIYDVGTLTITNSTLSNNSASGTGGGIFNGLAMANISFTTLSGNSASSGGGIFNNTGGTVNIKNSIVANSTSGGDCSNLATFNATGTNFTTNGTCPGFTVVTSAQLNLGPLGNYGGPTQTHSLQPGSVAIDAAPDCTDVFGNPNSPKVGAPKALVTTDQRGVGRPQGSACDVGSYEFVPCTRTPAIVCPESFTTSTDATHCSAVVDFSAEADCPCENGGGLKPSPPKGVGLKAPSSPTQGCMVSCAPAAGSTFPLGATTVTCTATDSFGNTSKPCSFTITVTDQSPPIVSCPSNIVKSTDPNQCSTTANYTATATDNCDGPLTPTCAPQSGSTFQKGVTTVTCMATDSSKNTGTCSFTVTVNDTQPPSITCPANVTTNADPNQCSTVVNYPAPTVSDNCPGVGTPVCSPASGSTFPGGTTTVTCSVSDSSNNTSSCSFTVTVRDTQPPTITCPANITFVAAATCPPTNSMPVNFTVTANDNCSGLTVVCRNQNGVVVTSGQPFPVGTTTVTCTATDSSGNTATCSFTVSGFNFCLQDDQNPGNVVLINAVSGDYRFCCGGVLVATGTGTLTTRGCIGSIDHTKGDRRVHIQWDTAANGVGEGTAIIQVSPNKTVCQITDRNMVDNTCSCSSAQPASKVKP
jgi:hypothetical protein